MAEIVKRSKALSVNPLKVSQPVGASLAFLGIRRAIPMLHGSQGCTAFGKVFFVRHFREPIPLQTTAMDQGSTVMGADENVIEGLASIAAKSAPDLIGLPTTGLSETEGTDIHRLVREFRARHPEFAAIPVVPVNTPDYVGSLESGYALAVKAIIEAVVPSPTQPSPACGGGQGRGEVGRRKKQVNEQVNVLAGSLLTPGDIEHIKELIEQFGLRPVVLPDLSDSLDGHLTSRSPGRPKNDLTPTGGGSDRRADPGAQLIDLEFSPVTVGGTPVGEIARLGEAAATLVIGRSMNEAADLLHERTGVPDFRFDSLMGLDGVDAFVATLADISGRPVPERIERQRAQLQDAMVDTHFMLGLARFAIAADPDLLYGLADLVTGMGGEVTAAVAPSKSTVLAAVPAAEVKLGDLEDLELAIRARGADLVIANSHAADTARRLGLPLLRAGFPQYDLIGGYQKRWVGYAGTRQTLFDLANILLTANHGEVEPYRSLYATRGENDHAASQTRPVH